MALLNPFQIYTMEENTVTNNVLLMLSGIYEINPNYYEEFINGIIEEDGKYEVTPLFEQQVKTKKGGVVDGSIQIKASKIIIEAKRKGVEDINKLLKYAKSFDENEQNLLIHLSTDKYSEPERKKIKQRLGSTHNNSFYTLTYQELVDQLNGLASSYQYLHSLQKMSEDFEDYCFRMKLISKNNILRIAACKGTLELNIKHQFYTCRINHRFFSGEPSMVYNKFKYLGFYSDKLVKHIGLVENIVDVDFDEKNEKLIIHASAKSVTEYQKKRLKKGIKHAINEWNKGRFKIT